nr:hypothetical protein CFP56_10288 [Quercus suber]
MATPILYRISVPFFITQLEGLRTILKQGAESCKAGKHDEKTLIESRLIDDMLPLAFQVQICCKLAGFLGQVAPVAPNSALPPSSDDPKNNLGWIYEPFADLDSRIVVTLEYLRSLDAKSFEGKEDDEVQFMSRKFQSGFDFVEQFMLPNCKCWNPVIIDVLTMRRLWLELMTSSHVPQNHDV